MVELENHGFGGPRATISYEGNTYYYNKTTNTQPPMIPTTIGSSSAWYYNRGTHDYSLARGNYNNGSLTNGLRYANFSAGYYDKNLTNYHNYGILELINLVEKIGREWYRQFPSGPRMGLGNISLQNGGNTPEHAGHENGTEIDIRYVRRTPSGGTYEAPLSVETHPLDYDQSRTTELVGLFLLNHNVSRIFVDPNTNISNSTYTYANGRITVDLTIRQSDGRRVHSDHFHVQITDPDGTGN